MAPFPCRGVVSVSELAEAGFEMPEELSRYTGGLIIEDLNGDWILDPAEDRVIGGVMHGGPDGASGEDLRSAVRDGAATLSRPTTAFTPGAGRAFGGAILLVQYTVGDAPGHYRPTFALLADPDDLGSGDGSSYTPLSWSRPRSAGTVFMALDWRQLAPGSGMGKLPGARCRHRAGKVATRRRLLSPWAWTARTTQRC